MTRPALGRLTVQLTTVSTDYILHELTPENYRPWMVTPEVIVLTWDDMAKLEPLRADEDVAEAVFDVLGERWLNLVRDDDGGLLGTEYPAGTGPWS